MTTSAAGSSPRAAAEARARCEALPACWRLWPSSHGALIFVAPDLAGMATVIALAGATIAPMAASIYAMAGRAAPQGTATEAFSWLYAASATGAAIGAALAGAISQTAGAGAAFGLGGAAGAAAVVVAMTAAR
jgi:hypothetical protein